MGLFSGIGKVFGGIAKTVGKVAGGISTFLQRPLSELISPIKSFVGKIADKLPFGVGKLVKPFIEKFFSSVSGALAAGSLGGLGFIAKLMTSTHELAGLFEKIRRAAEKFADKMPPQGIQNLQNIAAEAQAGLLA